jgi:hypothetical protein
LPQISNAAGTACINAIEPTVDVKNTTERTPVALTGKYGTNSTISTVTLTKMEDGLGNPIFGDSPYTAGSSITNISAVSGTTTWTTPTPSALEETVGKYRITATDEAGQTATNILTVTCQEGEITTPVSCIKSTNPTVISKTVKERDPIELEGTVGSVVLDNSEAFTVQVNGKTYDKANAASGLTVSGLNWTLNIPSVDLPTILAANSPYTVTATRSVTLTETGTLTVEALNTPTVEKQTTFDTTPVIKGTVGDAALATGEAFTVAVNGKTYTNGVDVNLVINSKDWTLTILAGSEISARTQPYDVVATRGTQIDKDTDDLTIQACALPKVVSIATDGRSSCIDPVPTVDSTLPASPISTDVLPVNPLTIKGTVGTVELGASEEFSVTVKVGSTGGLTGFTPQTYTYKTDSALTVNAKEWTLVIPTNKALSDGTYEIEAARNKTAKDTSHDELVINLDCLDDQVKVNGSSCASSSTLPTVNSLSTDDRTPTLTGTVGTTELNGDSFSVKIEGTGRTYTLGSSSELTVTGKIWSLAVPHPPMTPTTYSVTATRADTIVDATSNELTISAQCIPPNIEEEGDCISVVKTPTVNKLVTDISAQTIEVTGTVGNVVLADNESFTVRIHNAQHSDVACSLVVTGKTWTCTLTSKPFVAGVFDVDAVRAGVTDGTSGELEITDNIEVCDRSQTPPLPKLIPKADWDGVNYTVGECSDSTHSTTKPNPFPDEPQGLTPQATPEENPYCDDGGLRSNVTTTGATIKRATIINASTDGGTVTSSLVDKFLKYGEKNSAIGTIGISGAIIDKNSATGATLTGVTLTDAVIDINGSFDLNTGVFTPSDIFINATGGSTSPSYSSPKPVSTIINGVIVAGADANGQPIRGSVTSGRYNTNATPSYTKSRRITGKLVDATITNAHIVTINGKTVVDSGTITAGTIEGTVSAFGTVQNAVITGAQLTESTHCFSSGTVGNKGQLNWKEVVK